MGWLGERGQTKNWTSNVGMCERGQLVVASGELMGAILGKAGNESNINAGSPDII